LGGWAHFLGEEVPAQTAELQQMHGKRGSIWLQGVLWRDGLAEWRALRVHGVSFCKRNSTDTDISHETCGVVITSSQHLNIRAISSWVMFETFIFLFLPCSSTFSLFWSLLFVPRLRVFWWVTYLYDKSSKSAPNSVANWVVNVYKMTSVHFASRLCVYVCGCGCQCASIDKCPCLWLCVYVCVLCVWERRVCINPLHVNGIWVDFGSATLTMRGTGVSVSVVRFVCVSECLCVSVADTGCEAVRLCRCEGEAVWLCGCVAGWCVSVWWVEKKKLRFRIKICLRAEKLAFWQAKRKKETTFPH
jgi:hypothetical protein